MKCDDCAALGRAAGTCAKCKKKLCHACFISVHECEHGILAEPTIAFDEQCGLREDGAVDPRDRSPIEPSDLR